MSAKVNVLFVCLGNICRSPLAEGIFEHLVEEAGLEDKILVDSCGTSGYHVGQEPDPRSIEIAQRHGIELRSKARQWDPTDLDEFHFILPMDQSNLRNIQADISGNHLAEIRLMRDFDPDFKGLDVPDPYYGGRQGFKDVYDMLIRSNAHFLQHLREKHSI